MPDFSTVNVMVGDDIVAVPCRGMFRPFFKEFLYNYNVTNEAASSLPAEYLQKDLKRATNQIRNAVFEFFEERATIEQHHDPVRGLEFRYKLQVPIITPNQTQLLINAALGDGEALQQVVLMLGAYKDDLY